MKLTTQLYALDAFVTVLLRQIHDIHNETLEVEENQPINLFAAKYSVSDPSKLNCSGWSFKHKHLMEDVLCYNQSGLLEFEGRS